jgi:hypothetical protein
MNVTLPQCDQSTRFNRGLFIVETINGNFSTTTLLVSKPKPFSSESDMSFSQK